MNFLQSRKIIWLFVLIALVAVGLYGYSIWRDKRLAEQEYTPKLTREVVPQEQVPSYFPTGIPLEDGSEILQNIITRSDTGGFQATRVFVTKRSISQNQQLYKEYFANNKWTQESAVDQPTLKSMTMRKDNLLVQVVLNEAERNTVEINVTQAPPAPTQ